MPRLAQPSAPRCPSRLDLKGSHVQVGSYAEGERALLLKSLDALQADDIPVLDRGYPGWWLFSVLQERGIQFCMRAETSGLAIVTSLMRSSERERVIEHKLGRDPRRALRELGLTGVASVKLRVVKVHLPNGRLQVMVTS